MAVQTVQFESVSLAEIGSGTLTAYLYLDDALVATLADITENATLKGRYTGTTSDTAADTYRLVVKFDGYTISDPGETVTLLLATGTYVATTGGAGDATLANQLLILDQINNYISSALAGIQFTPGAIVNFPTTLNIGDSYTDDCNAAIHVFIRDANDDPITSVGDHDFTDLDFAPECIITQNGNVGRVTCEVTYVEASPENYLKVQIPSKESRRATPGVATVQVLLKWDGAQKALGTETLTWVALI